MDTQSPTLSPKTGYNALSIMGLVIAVFSVLLMALLFVHAGLVVAIVGFIVSIVALVQIKKRNQKGRIYAVLALVISCIGTVLVILSLLELAGIAGYSIFYNLFRQPKP